MKNHQHSPAQPSVPRLIRFVLLGAMIGLAIISFFVFGVGQQNPAWPDNWRIRPLLVVPSAGAVAGLSSYFTVRFGTRLGLNKIILWIPAILLSLFALWIGIILGLDGTLWD
ncbi:hypothetical protein [Pedobacter sp. V48]|uniref:hypothetical protein n=1 Tax=Pedobacter sp. V48 TaxID=509635 RepID=UPI0003E4D924|nr:hypothetical protein [Pedobacter sp. V48]ETZ22119.1 hypothetical protein N824_24655 [Pedobacter sp. V48]